MERLWRPIGGQSAAIGTPDLGAAQERACRRIHSIVFAAGILPRSTPHHVVVVAVSDITTTHGHHFLGRKPTTAPIQCTLDKPSTAVRSLIWPCSHPRRLCISMWMPSAA